MQLNLKKKLHQEKIERYCSEGDSRRVWQGLQVVTSYKAKPSGIITSSASFPDDLNNFYARFECAAEALTRGTSPTGDVHVKVPSYGNTYTDLAVKHIRSQLPILVKFLKL